MFTSCQGIYLPRVMVHIPVCHRHYQMLKVQGLSYQKIFKHLCGNGTFYNNKVDLCHHCKFQCTVHYTYWWIKRQKCWLSLFGMGQLCLSTTWLANCVICKLEESKNQCISKTNGIRLMVYFLPLTSTWPYLRCDVGLEEGEYREKLSMSCSIVYYYNGAQRYEQFLQVGQYRALILLSLALFLSPLCLRSSWCYIYIYIYIEFFCLRPSIYLLVSWAWLTNNHPSVLWHCWLGHLTRKIVSKMTYNVLSGTLNTTILLYLMVYLF